MATNADEPRVERTFYPNGQIETEVTYVGEHIEGVTRHWHENGTLKEEVPVRKSRTHGTVRQWDAAGNLLDTSEFVDGTGTHRSFHANGTLAGVSFTKNGIPHGYLRCWDEGGELSAEVFYVNGRKVSRKRYEQARKDDESLPEPPSKTTGRAVGLAARASRSGVAVQRTEQDLAELLSAGPHSEALVWLRQTDGTLGEGISGAEAIKLIEKALPRRGGRGDRSGDRQGSGCWREHQ